MRVSLGTGTEESETAVTGSFSEEFRCDSEQRNGARIDYHVGVVYYKDRLQAMRLLQGEAAQPEGAAYIPGCVAAGDLEAMTPISRAPVPGSPRTCPVDRAVPVGHGRQK